MSHHTELLDTLIKYGLVEGLCEIFSTSTDEDTLVCIFLPISLMCFVCMTYMIMFDKLMSTLLGCAITENIGFIKSGLASCSESFVMRLQRMIIV